MAAAVRALKNKQIREKIAERELNRAARETAKMRAASSSSDGLSHRSSTSPNKPPRPGYGESRPSADSMAESVYSRDSAASNVDRYAPGHKYGFLTELHRLVHAVTGWEAACPLSRWPQPSCPPPSFWRYQPRVRHVYCAQPTQLFIAILIVLNFLANVVEKEIDPRGTQYKQLWRSFEHAFNAMFLAELLVNAYARWFYAFWCDAWNIFDFVVVAVGCVSFFTELAGPLKLLRTLRAFRVFRLFRRVKSLNQIITLIVAAIPGVLNTFIVMIISISIYSLIGVEFFSTFGTHLVNASSGALIDGEDDPTFAINSGCSYTLRDFKGEGNAATVQSLSYRDLCFGWEYYGTFTRAWYTLFQILTSEAWSESVARPILFGWDDYGPGSVYLSSIYFISFILVNCFILFNVFVAVLLDKIVQPDHSLAEELMLLDQEEEEEEAREAAEREAEAEEEEERGRREAAAAACSSVSEAPESKPSGRGCLKEEASAQPSSREGMLSFLHPALLQNLHPASAKRLIASLEEDERHQHDVHSIPERDEAHSSSMVSLDTRCSEAASLHSGTAALHSLDCCETSSSPRDCGASACEQRRSLARAHSFEARHSSLSRCRRASEAASSHPAVDWGAGCHGGAGHAGLGGSHAAQQSLIEGSGSVSVRPKQRRASMPPRYHTSGGSPLLSASPSERHESESDGAHSCHPHQPSSGGGHVAHQTSSQASKHVNMILVMLEHIYKQNEAIRAKQVELAATVQSGQEELRLTQDEVRRIGRGQEKIEQMVASVHHRLKARDVRRTVDPKSDGDRSRSKSDGDRKRSKTTTTNTNTKSTTTTNTTATSMPRPSHPANEGQVAMAIAAISSSHKELPGQTTLSRSCTASL